MKPVPDLIVFRLPDDADGNKQFLQAPILADGHLGEDAECFTALDGDSYNMLGFHELVLAQRQGDAGSLELTRVEIIDATTRRQVVLYSDMMAVMDLFPDMLESWQND